MHRDYLISAPIKLFIFDDRIEIVSPGRLPNNLTVEKIRTGNSNIRNPILVSYVAKGLLPYHGLGSGITRALSVWPHIDFTDDYDGNLFIASVRRENRPDQNSGKTSEKKPKTSEKISGTSEKKPKTSEKNSDSSEKTSVASEKKPKTSEKIIGFIRERPSITTGELSALTGITRRSVERNIDKLRVIGIIQRVGPDKGGHWRVNELEVE
jgi:ATP-dependent DNA helicase RecG